MTDETGTPAAMSAAAEAAWGIRARPGKGPKPGLSLDRIVRTAIELATAGGLDAVSMSRVATELGVSPMALYRYVSAKDELVALMVDAAWGPPPEPPAVREGWREELSRWAWVMVRRARPHPWAALAAPSTGLPQLPNQVGWVEQALQAMSGIGLTHGERMSVLLLITGYVRNYVVTMAQVAEVFAATGDPEAAMRAWADQLRTVATADRFPALNAVLDSGVIDQPDPEDEEFAFGLDRILDGVEVLVRDRAAGTS